MSTSPSTSAPPTITLSSLTFLKPTALASLLRDPATSSTVAIVDVRDSDHVGGHIRGSLWVPTDQLDARMPELLRTLADKHHVVFHCMLSQQRGPKAALQYARAKAYNEQKRQRREQPQEQQQQESGAGQAGKTSPKQEVCVLEGGFGNWQALYGEDETLTEGYAKDLWE